MDQTKEGFAFGRWGDLYVYLPRGLINDYTNNRAEFRAIVLHELAHLQNGDVHQTYLSYTVWWAFLVTSVPVFAVIPICFDFATDETSKYKTYDFRCVAGI